MSIPTDCCAVCPGTHRCVRGHGPRKAHVNVVCIGERPGYSEDFGGLPFIGQAGEEFNSNYLRLAGLTRDLESNRPDLDTDIYLTNTVKCRNASSNIKPSKKEIEVCGRHWLPREVESASPTVIVLMGGTACSLVGNPKIDLDTEHGIPRWVEKCEYFGDWSGWVVPMYHPAAGMHQTNLMIPLLEDWENLGGWLKGTWKAPAPVDAVKIMRRLTTRGEVLDSIGDWDQRYEFLPLDTESDEGRPFSIQYSPAPDRGFMILAEDTEAIKIFSNVLFDAWGGKLAMHNSLYDLDELERHYGWTGIEVIDTMIESYHLGNLPQGLKALTYRLTGVRMTSYQDVVVPASKSALSDWLIDAVAFVADNWKMQRPVKKQPKTFAAKGLVKYEDLKHPSESVLRRLLRFVGPDSDSESDYDPWQEPKKLGTEDEEVRLIGRDWLESVEAHVGRMPRKSIVHASLPRAIEYGCLSNHSRIITEEGPIPIGTIVRNRMSLKVLSIGKDGEQEMKPITNWVRNRYGNLVRWHSVVTDMTRTTGRGLGTRYTPDHELMTRKGWRRVDSLRPGDKIYRPEKRLDSVEIQTVLGSILGDGSLSRRNAGGWASLSIDHCAKQLPYLEWKRDLLQSIVSCPLTFSDPKPRMIVGKTVYPTRFHHLRTVVHPELHLLKTWDDPKRKRVGNWISDIDELALAIWYQDDGTFLKGDSARFYTMGFPVSDVDSIRTVMDEKFGLDTTMFFVDSQPIIGLRRRSSEIFFEMISKYVHPCMQYKLPVRWQGKFVEQPLRYEYGLVEATVQEVIVNTAVPSRRDMSHVSYCLEIADNHNFVTVTGEIAHNCSDAIYTGHCVVRLAERRVEQQRKWKVDEGDWDA